MQVISDAWAQHIIRPQQNRQEPISFISPLQKIINIMKDSSKSRFAVVIECCQNCAHHNWCSRHQEAKYDQHYHELKRKIEAEVPEVLVSKNQIPLAFKKILARFPDDNRYINEKTRDIVQYPRLGAFEIYADGYLIFSKIESNLWPCHNRIVALIHAMQMQKKQGKDLAKYSLENRIYNENDEIFKITYNKMIQKEYLEQENWGKPNRINSSLQRSHVNNSNSNIELTPQLKKGIKIRKIASNSRKKKEEPLSYSHVEASRKYEDEKSGQNGAYSDSKPPNKFIRPIQKHRKQYQDFKTKKKSDHNFEVWSNEDQGVGHHEQEHKVRPAMRVMKRVIDTKIEQKKTQDSPPEKKVPKIEPIKIFQPDVEKAEKREKQKSKPDTPIRQYQDQEYQQLYDEEEEKAKKKKTQPVKEYSDQFEEEEKPHKVTEKSDLKRSINSNIKEEIIRTQSSKRSNKVEEEITEDLDYAELKASENKTTKKKASKEKEMAEVIQQYVEDQAQEKKNKKAEQMAKKAKEEEDLKKKRQETQKIQKKRLQEQTRRQQEIKERQERQEAERQQKLRVQQERKRKEQQEIREREQREREEEQRKKQQQQTEAKREAQKRAQQERIQRQRIQRQRRQRQEHQRQEAVRAEQQRLRQEAERQEKERQEKERREQQLRRKEEEAMKQQEHLDEQVRSQQKSRQKHQQNAFEGQKQESPQREQTQTKPEEAQKLEQEQLGRKIEQQYNQHKPQQEQIEKEYEEQFQKENEKNAPALHWQSEMREGDFKMSNKEGVQVEQQPQQVVDNIPFQYEPEVRESQKKIEGEHQTHEDQLVKQQARQQPAHEEPAAPKQPAQTIPQIPEHTNQMVEEEVEPLERVPHKQIKVEEQQKQDALSQADVRESQEAEEKADPLPTVNWNAKYSKGQFIISSQDRPEQEYGVGGIYLPEQPQQQVQKVEEQILQKESVSQEVAEHNMHEAVKQEQQKQQTERVNQDVLVAENIKEEQPVQHQPQRVAYWESKASNHEYSLQAREEPHETIQYPPVQIKQVEKEPEPEIRPQQKQQEQEKKEFQQSKPQSTEQLKPLESPSQQVEARVPVVQFKNEEVHQEHVEQPQAAEQKQQEWRGSAPVVFEQFSYWVSKPNNMSYELVVVTKEVYYTQSQPQIPQSPQQRQPESYREVPAQKREEPDENRLRQQQKPVEQQQPPKQQSVKLRQEQPNASLNSQPSIENIDEVEVTYWQSKYSNDKGFETTKMIQQMVDDYLKDLLSNEKAPVGQSQKSIPSQPQRQQSIHSKYQQPKSEEPSHAQVEPQQPSQAFIKHETHITESMVVAAHEPQQKIQAQPKSKTQPSEPQLLKPIDDDSVGWRAKFAGGEWLMIRRTPSELAYA